MDPEFKLRLYQETILNTAASSNCLVVLPTGLGKTAIAAALIKNRLQNYIGSKVIFRRKHNFVYWICFARKKKKDVARKHSNY